MNTNELSLDVAKTFNLKTMRLIDTSKYCNEVVIENYIIEVLPVNRKNWSTLHVNKYFQLTLNSSSLGYKRVNNEAGLIDLPDGIYEIKQSHKQNSSTVVHFYHLRTVALTLKYLELLCTHFSSQCSLDRRTYEEETNKLMKIKGYIDAAEYAVGEKHDKQMGIDFYNKAVSLIDEFERNCGCK